MKTKMALIKVGLIITCVVVNLVFLPKIDWLHAEPVVPIQPWTVEAPARDEIFVALMAKALKIESLARAWNTYCGDNPDTQGCTETRDVIAGQLTEFIEAAITYKTEGTDCRADLRRRTIAFETHLFKYDLAYGGRKATSEKEIAEREKANAEIEAEKGPLEKDMQDCMNADKPKI